MSARAVKNPRRQEAKSGAVECPVCRRDRMIYPQAQEREFRELCTLHDCRHFRRRWMKKQGWLERVPEPDFTRLVNQSAVMVLTRGGRARRCWMKLPRSLAVGNTPKGHSFGRISQKESHTTPYTAFLAGRQGDSLPDYCGGGDEPEDAAGAAGAPAPPKLNE